MVRPVLCRVLRGNRISPKRALVNPNAQAGSVTPLHLDQTCRIRSPAAIYPHDIHQYTHTGVWGTPQRLPASDRLAFDLAPELRFDDKSHVDLCLPRLKFRCDRRSRRLPRHGRRVYCCICPVRPSMGLGRTVEAPNTSSGVRPLMAADSMTVRSTFRDESMVDLNRTRARDAVPYMLGV